jgi:hypothetical protein
MSICKSDELISIDLGVVWDLKMWKNNWNIKKKDEKVENIIRYIIKRVM